MTDAGNTSKEKAGDSILSQEIIKELREEYFRLFSAVESFDNRLLTVKAWGVTAGLAVIASAVKDNCRDLFLIASLSGLCFWVIECVFKAYQIRYYTHMRYIEFRIYESRKASNGAGINAISPAIDAFWSGAGGVFGVRCNKKDEVSILKVKLYQKSGVFFAEPFFYLGVLLPHFITVVVGLIMYFR